MKAESTRVQQQTMNQTPSQQRSAMSQKSTPYSQQSTPSAKSTPHSASSRTPQSSPIFQEQAYASHTPQSSQASLRTPLPSSSAASTPRSSSRPGSAMSATSSSSGLKPDVDSLHQQRKRPYGTKRLTRKAKLRGHLVFTKIFEFFFWG